MRGKQLMVKTGWVSAVIGGLGFLCAGCVSYKPPAIAPSEMAYVKEMDFYNYKVFINRIDGIDSLGANGGDYNTPIGIAPGKRTLGVMWNFGSLYAHGDVTFVAEAGKTYSVMGYCGEPESDSIFSAMRVYFFVEDDQTGENVSEKFENVKK